MSIVHHSQKWLPLSAIEDGKLSSWVSSVLEEWYESWVGADFEKTISIVRKSTGRFELLTSHFIANGPGIKMSARAHEVLAEKMIDLSLNDAVTNTVDKTLLKGMVDQSIADLLYLMSIDIDDVEVQEGRSTETWVSGYVISIDEEVIFDLALPMDYCVLRRKNLALPVKMESPEFGDIQTAVLTTMVNLDAKVGQVELDIEKITQLKIGTVIEFDKTLAQGFPLRANGELCDDLQARFVLTRVKKGARKQPGFILENIDE